MNEMNPLCGFVACHIEGPHAHETSGTIINLIQATQRYFIVDPATGEYREVKGFQGEGMKTIAGHEVTSEAGGGFHTNAEIRRGQEKAVELERARIREWVEGLMAKRRWMDATDDKGYAVLRMFHDFLAADEKG